MMSHWTVGVCGLKFKSQKLVVCVCVCCEGDETLGLFGTASEHSQCETVSGTLPSE